MSHCGLVAEGRMEADGLILIQEFFHVAARPGNPQASRGVKTMA